MLSKRARPGTDAVPLAKRFRRNVADLVLNNEISAGRAQDLSADAQAAGARHVEDFAAAGCRGCFGE